MKKVEWKRMVVRDELLVVRNELLVVRNELLVVRNELLIENSLSRNTSLCRK
jgi:hypothetical protein